jgi:hypothetical protein
VKFLVSKDTTQTTCLRLMGKKMLVALTMEGKFSGEGIHSLESDDDMLSAMARELVERGRVGESADAVWADLKRERALHISSKLAQPEPKLQQDTVTDTDGGLPGKMPLFLPQTGADPLPTQSAAKLKQRSSPLWPTVHAEARQMLLFA